MQSTVYQLVGKDPASRLKQWAMVQISIGESLLVFLQVLMLIDVLEEKEEEEGIDRTRTGDAQPICH